LFSRLAAQNVKTTSPVICS